VEFVDGQLVGRPRASALNAWIAGGCGNLRDHGPPVVAPAFCLDAGKGRFLAKRAVSKYYGKARKKSIVR
jgi:hypothetical protein